MSKDRTPDNKIVQAIRRYIWLPSRERSFALSRDSYTCQRCGVKRSIAKGKEQKVESHHKNGIKWDRVIRVIRREVLQKPENLETLCQHCHREVKE